MRAINGITAQRFGLPSHVAFIVLATVALTIGALFAMHAVATPSPHAHPIASASVTATSHDSIPELLGDVGQDDHHDADCSDHDSLRQRAVTTVVFADQAPAVVATHVFLAYPDTLFVPAPKPDEQPDTEVDLVTDLSVSRI